MVAAVAFDAAQRRFRGAVAGIAQARREWEGEAIFEAGWLATYSL